MSKILHITNDYSGSTVYKNLIRELDSLNYTQIVYNPIREKARIGKNTINFTVQDSKIIYSHILNKNIDRILYRRKLRKIILDIESKININEISIIHAHTWFSDGGVAYALAKKYNIPYIVAVRNTDLNVFWKYLFFNRNFGIKIIKKSSYIISISNVYSLRIKEICEKENVFCDTKLIQIPNGIDSFWLDNIVEEKRERKNEVKNVIYVGKFNSGKNIIRLLNAIKKLSDQGEEINLKLVGGGGTEHNKVMRIIKRNPLCFSFLGKIQDQKDLISIYRSSDIFVMPSLRETFGLVYVEAISQGLPIIYSKNEGIDGMYNLIGESVDPKSTENISQSIRTVINNYDKYEIPVKQIKDNHDWKKIALKYKVLYEDIVNSSVF